MGRFVGDWAAERLGPDRQRLLTYLLAFGGLALLVACDDKWTPVDLDEDGVTPSEGDCDDLDAEAWLALYERARIDAE